MDKDQIVCTGCGSREIKLDRMLNYQLAPAFPRGNLYGCPDCSVITVEPPKTNRSNGMEDQKAEASGQEMGLGVPTMKSAKEQDVTAYRLIVMSEMATMLLDKAPTYRPKKAVPAIQMAQDFELAGDNVWLLSSTGVAGDYLVQKEDGMLMAMPRQEFEDSFRPTKRPATIE